MSAEQLVSRLIASFVSPESMRILEAVAERGPVAPKSVTRVAGVDRTRCYCLLGELRGRGLIRLDRDGYTLAAAEVWAMVKPAVQTPGSS